MDQVSQIRNKIDIVSFISEYVVLKKIGRNFTACCPFHNEKTPSFVVSPERQIWHCFGCSKGGDCFTFLMEYERMEFLEALRFLAKKTGIELIEKAGVRVETSQKEKIYKINRIAAEYYHYVLTSHSVGEKALDYLLKERKIKEQIVKTFMLGFSPGSGSALSAYLTGKKNFKGEDIVEAGLATFRNKSRFDFFVNRLIFPIFDHRDNIVGFSGRLLADSNSTSGKYINTRETVVYHKGDIFFGLNIAKEKIKNENQAIIMEGEFDVISSFQEGISNAIAVKGTALTENQVSLISRFCSKVTLCFDGDSAGEAAIKRSLPMLEKKGLTTTVVVLSNGKDADEAIKNDAYVFKNAIKTDIGIYDFLLDKTVRKFNKVSIDGKKKIGDELLPVFSQIENEIIKEHYLKKLSTEIDTSSESLLRQIEKLQRKDILQLVKSNTRIKKPRKEILEEYILSLIIQFEDPKIIFNQIKNNIKDFMFDILAFQKIFKSLLNYFEKNDTFENKKFLEELPLELVSAFDKCYLFPLPKFDDNKKYKEEILKKANELKELYIKGKVKEISERIKEKEKNGEFESITVLQEEMSSLLKT